MRRARRSAGRWGWLAAASACLLGAPPALAEAPTPPPPGPSCQAHEPEPAEATAVAALREALAALEASRRRRAADAHAEPVIPLDNRGHNQGPALGD
jgi:hypothetical protein